ncbi:MAG TPA: nicotinate (nicotinamide) nucleotide adenylyltransferase [Verrucomicrobiae bacterium]|nr:nicotinate (nicotinamide) nucleotide adenylyltransferase [Verrucomicrobiae bacterium]
MRLGLFGGTFDPVHRGHVEVARRALAWGLDGVVVVPCRQSPHKPVAAGAPVPADGRHRWEMLRLAFRGEGGVSLSRCELDRQGPSYTRDTLAELRSQHPGADWVLVLGADQLPALPRWVGFCDWANGVGFLVFGRPGCAIEIGAAELRGLPIDVIQDFEIPVSATEIRGRFGRGESVAGMLPDGVEAYILRHGLYGAQRGRRES